MNKEDLVNLIKDDEKQIRKAHENKINSVFMVKLGVTPEYICSYKEDFKNGKELFGSGYKTTLGTVELLIFLSSYSSGSIFQRVDKGYKEITRLADIVV